MITKQIFENYFLLLFRFIYGNENASLHAFRIGIVCRGIEQLFGILSAPKTPCVQASHAYVKDDHRVQYLEEFLCEGLKLSGQTEEAMPTGA